MKHLIQIGANNGNDHVSKFIKNKEYKCILVEPNPFVFKQLLNHYNNCSDFIFENIAISTFNGMVAIFFNDIDNINGSEHSSVSLDHLYKHGHTLNRNITPKEIVCTTLTDLIIKHNWQNIEIDYLFIDTEGHDCDIILNTDFSKMYIKTITFEITHSDGPFTKGQKLENTKKHLCSFGYKEINGIDIFGTSMGDISFTMEN